MKKFRVLFYRPDIDHRLLDNAISGWTLLWNSLGQGLLLIWGAVKFNKAEIKERWKNLRLLWLLRCSHTEIWTPDENGVFANTSPYSIPFGEKVYNANTVFGTCYTATMGQTRKNKVNGSVKRPASEILTTPHRWFYFEFEVCDESFNAMVNWMDLQVANNQGYDKKDIVKFFLPIRTQNSDDNQKICSGFSWIAVFIAAIREFVYCDKTDLTDSERQLLALIKKRTKKNLPSPLLFAYWIYKTLAKAIDLETGQEINAANSS